MWICILNSNRSRWKTTKERKKNRCQGNIRQRIEERYTMLLGDNRECHLREQQLRASDGRESRSASHYSKVTPHRGRRYPKRVLSIRLANMFHTQSSPIQQALG